MVTRLTNRCGSLTVELVVAMGILAAAVLPVAFSYVAEQHQCRLAYVRAVAMELVDGEMELLVAGQWRAYGDGVHDYPVTAVAARNLPPGKFTLTVTDRRLRLEWCPDRQGKPVVREAMR